MLFRSELVSKGKNISTTHSLFSGIDDETLQLIKEQNYTLVMDEVMEVIKPLDMYPDYTEYDDDEKQRICRTDMDVLETKKFIEIDSSYLIKWIEKDKILDRYKSFKEKIESGLIYFSAKTLLFETFPSKIFKEDIFKEIYVMTYQFEYQLQSYYFLFFNVPYEKFGVKKHRLAANYRYNFSLVTYDEYMVFDLLFREKLKRLFKIVSSPTKNSVGFKDHSRGKEKLSVKHYKEMTEEEVRLIKSKSVTFVCDQMCSETSRIMWTTFKDDKDKFLHKRLAEKNFVPINSRATNDYRNRDGLIYLVNRFINPYYNHLFSSKGIRVDQDMYALSEMLQWIFRSAIRDEKPIEIYIPSERMRGLLEEWLDGKY